MNNWGIDSAEDLLTSSFGFKYKISLLAIPISLILSTMYALLERYIYSPAEAPILLCFVTLLKTFSEVYIETKQKKKQLNVSRIFSFGPRIGVQLIVLGLTFQVAKIEGSIEWLPRWIFLYFILFSLFAFIEDLIQMGLLQKNFLTALLGILKTKVGAENLPPDPSSSTEPTPAITNASPTIIP